MGTASVTPKPRRNQSANLGPWVIARGLPQYGQKRWFESSGCPQRWQVRVIIYFVHKLSLRVV